MKTQPVFDFVREMGQEKDEKYSYSVESPIYKPSGRKPYIVELADFSTTQRLINKVRSSGVSDDEKAFLIEAAKRHTVFKYGLIADYYAQATPEMQRLMEDSALVIIDFDSAIENGFIRIRDDIAQQYGDTYDDDE